MSTVVSNESVRLINQDSNFDVNAELRAHAWCPQMTAIEAVAALSDSPSYTYVTHLREDKPGFTISFVNIDGQIEHHQFNVKDPIYNIWHNGMPPHVGKLEKVICDMMDCRLCECRPLF